jgi:hypothetical protein
VSGWLSEENGAVRAVPGVGGELGRGDLGRGDLGRAVQLYAKLLAAEEAARAPGRGRGSCPWLELKLAETYAWLRWSESEPNRRRGARAHLDEALLLAANPAANPAASLAEDAAPGTEPPPGCADEHLRARLAWLEARIP